MLYHSTRNYESTVDSAQAVLAGLAPDGGLYVPAQLPKIDVQAALQENTMQMAARIIGAMLPDIPNMETLVSRAYSGKFQTEELTPTVDTGKLYGNAKAGKDTLEIIVAGNDEQFTVTALFDNLGKGASGAAVQNMNIMLGLDETTGLTL